MELVCRHLSNHACARNPEDSPSLSVRSQHDAGTGVGGAGHPGAVNSEQHQHHQQGDDDDTLDVHAKALLLLRLVVFHFLRLAHLRSTGNNGERNSRPLLYLSTKGKRFQKRGFKERRSLVRAVFQQGSHCFKRQLVNNIHSCHYNGQSFRKPDRACSKCISAEVEYFLILAFVKPNHPSSTERHQCC